MSGIIAIRNFVLMTLLVAAAIAGAGSVAQATLASHRSAAGAGAESASTESSSSDACLAASVRNPLPVDLAFASPVEVRCSLVVERPTNGAFVTASAGVTVKDSDGNDVVRFDQPVGRTGAAASGNLVPSATLASRTYVPAGVVCAPLIGCNNAVNGPGNASARVLPGGSATTVATAGGSTTVTVTETCVNTAGGGCGTSGSSAAELSKVAVTRN